ncbi:MAG: methyltransferase domain-containing protein [Candidatus Hydrogenedentes bacterium]|nr:methyltransferase domain-containing protein [Candidatus Hydrogenedentota bacterium]
MPETPQENYVPALGFHFLTPVYDAVVRMTTRERTFKAALVAQANARPGRRVLDLACGTGTLAILIKNSSPGAEVIAIDGDEKILCIARKKAQSAGVAIQFDQGLSYDLPYPDGHFDWVTSSLFFHHLSWPDKQRTAQELHRVIRPGGQLHVADWGRATGPLMRSAFLAVQLIDGFENTRDNVKGRLPEVFAEAGFANVHETKIFATALGTMALYRAEQKQK